MTMRCARGSATSAPRVHRCGTRTTTINRAALRGTKQSNIRECQLGDLQAAISRNGRLRSAHLADSL